MTLKEALAVLCISLVALTIIYRAQIKKYPPTFRYSIHLLENR